MNRFSRNALAVATSSLTTLVTVPLVQAESSFLLEEIVVTAQKREESTGDVPIALSAFSDEFVKQTKIDDLKGLINFTPGLSGQSSDSFVETLSVRGVSSSDFGIGGDPSVGIYRDGIYHGRNGAAVSSFFDIERVEILKGPQGLLFGRNAASGAIHTITAKPSLEMTEGYVKVGAGEQGRRQSEFAYNQPLNDQWAIRIAATHSEEDGFIKNLSANGNDDMGHHNRDAVRFSLRHEASWGDATLTTEYEDREQSGAIYVQTDDNQNLITNDKRTVNSNFPDKDEGEIANAVLDINVNLSDSVTLSSITGYRTHNFSYQIDPDGSPEQILSPATDQHGDYFSQELRLNGEGEKLTWFAGVSYYQEDIKATNSNRMDEAVICGMAADAAAAGDPDAPAVVAYCGSLPALGTLTEAVFDKGEYKGWAAYGDMTYSFTEQLDVSFGLRYTHDEKKFNQNTPHPDGNFGPTVWSYYTTETIQDSDDWNDLSPRLAVRYFTNNDWLIYASATKGYKSGGFASNPVETTADDGLGLGSQVAVPGSKLKSFDPETIKSYEIGTKGTMLDNKLLLNASVYYYDYEDLQLITTDLGAINVQNLGQVDGYGLEIDIKAALTDYLDVFLGLAWSETDVDDIPLTTCNEFSGNSCNSNRLPYNPEWSASGGVIGRYALDSGEIRAGLDFTWQSEFYGNLDNEKRHKVDSAGFVNLRAGWISNDSWEINFYVENLFDKETFNSYDFDVTSYAAGPTKPRLAGVDFTYHFSM